MTTAFVVWAIISVIACAVYAIVRTRLDARESATVVTTSAASKPYNVKAARRRFRRRLGLSPRQFRRKYVWAYELKRQRKAAARA